MEKAKIVYNDKSVAWFMWASIIWGVVGMLVGVIVSLQLNISAPFIRDIGWLRSMIEFVSGGTANADGIPYITAGRMRPLHTNAVIFAFVGNMIFAGVYYSTQRLCKCRVASDLLTKLHFWLWQLIVVAAAITLPLGYTQGKEYAELVWWIDIMVVIAWVIFAWNFFWTLIKRNEQHLYVSIWFYVATIVTVAMLYIVNNIQIPTSLMHSYPIFAGAQDALVQWWYGHNAVAFFLTTPILGIMYYFLPKAANRPVYSYRLSVIHFWGLVFIYIWAGPHHLLNTALPQWLQMLGMLFSLVLWAPSWGGMLNGLLTLRGAWSKLQSDPVIKFMAASVTFYGMATFEGPLLSIKGVNALSHYTDWTIGHVHGGTLGWNGFMAAGVFYWMAPRIWKTELHSKAMANFHFWIGFIGVLLYVASMWVAGITQGLQLAEHADGASVNAFVKTLDDIQFPLMIRSLGGILYLLGFILLVYNLWRTCSKGKIQDVSIEAVLRDRNNPDKVTIGQIIRQDPFAAVLGLILCLVFWVTHPQNYFALAGIVFFGVLGAIRFKKFTQTWVDWHEAITKNYLPFTILTFFAAAIGGLVQIVPNALSARPEAIGDRLQVQYTPLELAGRDIYVSEGCYNCHSQMIRMLDGDVVRYGSYSRMGESIYDRPFQWGSKRTGPDLAREGGDYTDPAKFKYMRSGKKDNVWHYIHLMNPRDKAVESNMPSYSSLVKEKTDIKALPNKIRVLALMGDPWPAMTSSEIEQAAIDQGREIAKNLVENKVNIPWFEKDMTDEAAEARLAETKIVALISYLQKLGTYEVPSQDEPHNKPVETPDDLRDSVNN